MRKLLLPLAFGLALVQMTAANADSKLVLEGEAKKIVVKDQGINQSVAATATYDGTAKMSLAGAGIRIKSVPILGDYYVYVAQLFVSDVNALRDPQKGGLASLDAMKSIAIHMTITMDSLSNKKVVNAYKEALKDNNGINLADKDINDFLEAAKKIGDVVKGDTIVMVGLDSDTLVLESKGQELGRIKSAGLVKKVMSIWLGKTGSDDGLKNLKKELIGG